MRTASGLADLLRTLAALPRDERLKKERWDAYASVLGLQAPATTRIEQRSALTSSPALRTPPVESGPREPIEVAELPLTSFWRAVEFDVRDDAPTQRIVDRDARPLSRDDLCPPAKPPARDIPPIEPWSRLWPRLAKHLNTERAGHTPDTRALVDRIARGLPLTRIPRQCRRAWADRAVIVHARDPSHTWLMSDQVWLIEQLRRVMGARGIDVQLLAHGPSSVPFHIRRGHHREWESANSGTRLLMVGGFVRDTPGALTALSEHEQSWHRLGRRLHMRGYRPAALIACPVSRAVRGLSNIWLPIPWERHSWLRRSTPAELTSRAERLLTLAAPAVVVSRALLRELRFLLSADEADIGTEADVWAHPDVEITGYGLRFSPTRAQYWLQQFGQISDTDLQRRAWRLIRAHQQRYGRAVNHLSTWRLFDSATRSVISDDEAQATLEFVNRMKASADVATPDGLQRGLYTWFHNVCSLLPEHVYGDKDIGEGLSRMWYRTHGAHARRPAGLDPWLQTRTENAIHEIDLVHRRGGIRRTGPGSPVARLSYVDPSSIRCQGRPLGPDERIPPDSHIYLRTDSCRLTLERLRKPVWANAVSRDRYGLRATCSIAGVTLHMRWISPGRFTMGSPPDEPGRYDDEGPQHEVIVTDGFWLAETPCTQALWTAATGTNPSAFKSADRPVESVSFNDVQTFLDALNQRGGPDSLEEPFRLPSEAEWEYACRAGTREATYAGPIEILGVNNAPVLDDIAWYGGNSGRFFELDDGYDSSDWSEKQYPHEKAGSHPVAQKRRNPWGLYDMLGNIWEWCDDEPYSYSSERRRANDEPVTGKLVELAFRVVRGGSWFSGARGVRAAYRYWLVPSDACGNVGFRLARGQVK